MRPFFQLILAQAFLLAPCLASPQLPEDSETKPQVTITIDANNEEASEFSSCDSDAPAVSNSVSVESRNASAPLPYGRGYLRYAYYSSTAKHAFDTSGLIRTLILLAWTPKDTTLWAGQMAVNCLSSFTALLDLCIEECSRNPTTNVQDATNASLHRALTAANFILHACSLLDATSFWCFQNSNALLTTQYCALFVLTVGLNLYQHAYAANLLTVLNNQRAHSK